ncbi:putative death-receptor fusion protein-domain-containing protein [Colletotrichum godetiae]|uniref:Death-receptor fusion protein-domain-containing protein n=1 Tax=Colletotrichum godetiae TaxID=1209918 RepID=A0AAJ0AKQ1_9PEZI|nr:putative death-receptor fusion protein-domain-containing protein [Colletotrichum godetiae]KAK1675671.1 putative death-receptor fusion protein-domain-containing protein [Colletotrichum godetiae]
MKQDTVPQYESFVNPSDLLKWVEEQPEESWISIAQNVFDHLLSLAAQPKGVSGNACVKLCGFVEQSSKSDKQALRQWAFSKEPSLGLFNFFIKWNETEQHRSMKLVLDLLPSLIRRNPDHAVSELVKTTILDTLINIIGPQSTKPLVKSSLKAMDYFAGKSVFSVDDIAASYRRTQPECSWASDIALWEDFFGQMLDWMTMHYVCPTTGKFIVTIFRALRQQSLKPLQAAGAEQFSVETWLRWVQAAIAKTPSLLEGIKTYVFLPLFKDDRKDSVQILEQINSMWSTSGSAVAELDTLAQLNLAVLEVGKKVGMVEEPGAIYKEESSSAVVLEEAVLERVLSHPSHELRSLALSLIVASPSTTRPYSPVALRLLQAHLPTYFSESDAKFRMELLSKLKDMFKRSRGAIFILHKSLARLKAFDGAAKGAPKAPKAPPKQANHRTNILLWPEDKLRASLKQHEDFLAWYIAFLRSELIPTASFQRHFTALRAVAFILKLEADAGKTWETEEDETLFFNLFDGKWTRALLDLIMDPFDDVRENGTSVLKSLFADKRFKCLVGTQGVSPTLEEFLSRAEDIARRTARADHADGVARTNELLFRFYDGREAQIAHIAKLMDLLEGKLAFAEADLGNAVLEAPVHGYFASLRYIWQAAADMDFSPSEMEAMTTLQNRIVKCCQRIWAAVRDILCDDSPEGHLPQELEDLEGLDTKDLLSYSFRAIHESSALMRVMVLPLKSKAKEGTLRPSTDLFTTVGSLTFDQLSSLRHRGAFNTVSLSFATCCQLVKHLDDPQAGHENGETLLDVWYRGTKECIFSQASTTRRSAGIPAMITGIVSANASQPSFDAVIEELVAIARKPAFNSESDGSKLPQVHALNCLKDMFKSSFITQLGKSAPHIPQCLNLAAGSLKSEVWGIRNCGLLFLRSLLDNLFGTNESKATLEAGWDGRTTRLQYHKFPILPSVLLNLLRSGREVMKPTTLGSTIAAESVFPALDIIRRAGPPDASRDELYGLVAGYLASPVWHVREMAARALCSFLLKDDDWVRLAEAIINDSLAAAPASRNNHIHGGLLTVKAVFERLADVSPQRLSSGLPRVLSILSDLETSASDSFASCPDIRAAYLEVQNLISLFTLSHPSSSPSQTAASSTISQPPQSALLRTQLAIAAVHAAQTCPSPSTSLRETLLSTSTISVETTITTLETLASVHHPRLSPEQASSYAALYTDVARSATHPDSCAAALVNLAEVLDLILAASRDASEQQQQLSNLLPAPEILTQLWQDLLARTINPNLSNAITRASGPIMASLASQSLIASPSTAQSLRGWGNLMSSALHDSRPFDTRIAAAASLASFFSSSSTTPASSGRDQQQHDDAAAPLLPALTALYDALNDDDDEVRDLASLSAKHILTRPLAPIDAASALLSHISATYRHTPALHALLASRLTGQVQQQQQHASDETDTTTSNNTSQWTTTTADSQLASALRFDDSLFAIEEQNLFIDEVRESQRWAAVLQDVFSSSSSSSASSPTFSTSTAHKALTTWTSAGLDALLTLTSQPDHVDDGPLGWTSGPDVYAVCARVLLAAAALVNVGSINGDDGSEALKEKLVQLRSVGQQGRLHGLLLEMMDA